MATNLRHDPLPVFSFQVDLGMGGTAFFKNVGGLKYETETVPVKAGGVNDTTYNLVGATKRRRIDGVITQLDTNLKPKAQWTFSRGWPSKWEISEFDATKSELAIETLEISHDGLKYKAL
jgi:hypothetical protein